MNMKRFVSLLLVFVMVMSMGAMSVFATTDYTNGTDVFYDATADNDGDGYPDASEAYTVTVPAKIAPGDTASVTAAGTWASNRQLNVDADDTVTMEHSFNPADNKALNVTFAGIAKAGSNTTAVSATESLTVDGIGSALFGTWTGTINYTVEMVTVL